MATKETITLTELQRLISACMNVMSSIDMLGIGKDDSLNSLYNDVLGSLRKLVVATTLSKRQIICISGLQGAGKTTLMQNFYGLENVLKGTLGVGERLPVLITEKESITEPELYSVKIIKNFDGKMTEAQEKLELADYELVTHNNESDDSSKVMYFELFVPFKFIRSSSQYPTSFMLLPGWETNQRDDYYLNNLIDFSLNSSDAAVFVLNEQRVADYGGAEFLKKAQSIFGDNIVYVLTSTDCSLDNNDSLKQTLIEELHISGSKIVCSGYYPDDSEKNEAWKKDFMNAVEISVRNFANISERNSEYVLKEMSVLRSTLGSIRSELKLHSQSWKQNNDEEALLAEFDDRVKKMRKIVERKLHDQYAIAEHESAKRLVEEFNNKGKSAPVKNVVNNARRIFLGNNVNDVFVEPRKRLEAALGNDKDSIPGKYLSLAFGDTMKELCTSHSLFWSKLIDTKKVDKKTVLYEGDKGKALLADIRTLLTTDGSETLKTLETKSRSQLMCALVELGTYYFSLKCQEDIINKTGAIDTAYKPAEIIPNVDSILKGSESAKKFTLGIAGMMGIDAIADGKINFIPQIAQSIEANPVVVGSIFAAILVIGGSVVVIRDINKMNCDDYKASLAALNRIYTELEAKTLSFFDDYMDKIKERIRETLYTINGSQAFATAEYNAKVEITNAIGIINTISERCKRDATGLGGLLY